MRGNVWLLVAPMVLAVLAGCHTNPPPAGGDGGGDGNGDSMNGSGTPSVTVLEAPETATVGAPFTFAWRVDGPAETDFPHTAVHYGPERVPSDPTPADYEFGTNAPDYYAGMTPQEFSHDVTLNETGTYYYRAHAVVDGENYWTDEAIFPVAAMEILSTPSTTDGDFMFTVTMPMDAQTDHIGVHYSTTSGWTLSDSGLKSTPHLQNVTFTAGDPLTITEPFNAEEPGTYYARAHTRISGLNYLGAETEVTVS